MNEKPNKQKLSAREHAFQEWFISEVQAGIQEADAGDFATDEAVAAMYAKWGKQNISAQERAKRMRAVEEAHASMALSGEPVSEEEKKHANRYINGELTLEEFLDDTPPPALLNGVKAL